MRLSWKRTEIIWFITPQERFDLDDVRLTSLQKAILERRAIHLRYHSFSKDEMTERTVEPHRLFYSAGVWYFNGFCHLRQNRREFRLDRVDDLQLLEERFEQRPLTESSVEQIPVRIRFEAGAARWVRERQHYAFVSEQETAAGVEMCYAVHELREIIPWLRGWGAAAEPLVPLLFDEFDEPFRQIDSRVFLNLCALQDRHRERLAYVTATVKPLGKLRADEHCGEFSELFRHRSWFLAPLTRTDSERLIRRYMNAYEADFSAADVDFIIEWAGGPPNMLEGVCRALDTAITELGQGCSDPMARWQLHRKVARQLRVDPNLLMECTNIWRGLTDAEQSELLGLFGADHEPDYEIRGALVRRHILLHVEGEYQPFSRLMTEYAQHKVLLARQEPRGALWVDVENGEVLVGIVRSKWTERPSA